MNEYKGIFLQKQKNIEDINLKTRKFTSDGLPNFKNNQRHHATEHLDGAAIGHLERKRERV